MFEEGHLDKKRLEVDVQLTSGEHYRGVVFLGQEERLSDLFNDTRQFLPFEVDGGGVIILGKHSVVEIVPARAEVAGREQITDETDGMSLEIAEKLLALPKKHTRGMIAERANIMKNALSETGIDFDYVRSAIDVAAEALDSALKMKEIEEL